MPDYNYGYKQEYLAIKNDYDTQCSMSDSSLNTLISQLDPKVKAYMSANTDSPTINTLRTNLEDEFRPIGDYYTKLLSVKERLNTFLEKASDKVVESKDPILNEERYNNRANPEEAVKPRELVFGLFSELKPTSVPYLLASGVFMACISLLMIFQMFGFTGQINIPPALSELPGKFLAAAASSPGPFYQNPMILSGLVILLGAGVIGLGIMYYKAKQTSK
jgi:hypothetical protein